MSVPRPLPRGWPLFLDRLGAGDFANRPCAVPSRNQDTRGPRMISIIIPTFNEEKVIESTLYTLASTFTLPTSHRL